MPLPSIPAQLPKTQADWQQFANVMQAWQQSLTTLVWHAPALGASIANYGSGWAPAGYAKDATGRVHLRGLITGAGLIASATIFTLPLGYCVQQLEIQSALGTSGSPYTVCEIDLHPTGVVELGGASNGNPTSWLSLSGISFQTY